MLKPIFYDYVKTLDFHICIYLSILYLYYRIYSNDVINRQNYVKALNAITANMPTYIEVMPVPEFQFSRFNDLSADDQVKMTNLFDMIIRPLLDTPGSNNLETRLLAGANTIFNLTEQLPEDKHYCDDTLFDYNQFCVGGTHTKTPDPANVDYIAKCGSGQHTMTFEDFNRTATDFVDAPRSYFHSNESGKLANSSMGLIETKTDVNSFQDLYYIEYPLEVGPPRARSLLPTAPTAPTTP